MEQPKLSTPAPRASVGAIEDDALAKLRNHALRLAVDESLETHGLSRGEVLTAYLVALQSSTLTCVDESWAEEASRRAEQHFNGEMTAEDADVVAERIRANLQRR